MLAPSERYYLDRKRRPNKLTDRARQMLLMVKRWLPDRSIVVVADSSLAALKLLAAVREQLYSIVALAANALLAGETMTMCHAAWHAKDSPTFSDTIALVRRSIWGAGIFCTSAPEGDTVKIPRALFERLTETVCYAA